MTQTQTSKRWHIPVLDALEILGTRSEADTWKRLSCSRKPQKPQPQAVAGMHNLGGRESRYVRVQLSMRPCRDSPPDTRIILQPMGAVVGDQKLQLDSHGKEEYQKRHLQPHVHTRPLTRSSTHSLTYSTTNHSHTSANIHSLTRPTPSRLYIQPSTHSLTRDD